MTNYIFLYRYHKMIPEKYEIEIRSGEEKERMLQFRTQIDKPTYRQLQGSEMELEQENCFYVLLSEYELKP